MTSEEIISILENYKSFEDNRTEELAHHGYDNSKASRKRKEALDEAIKVLSVPEREKGEWIAQYHSGGNYDVYKCSCCDYSKEYCIIGHKDHFCPNCGADMRGKADE